MNGMNASTIIIVITITVCLADVYYPPRIKDESAGPMGYRLFLCPVRSPEVEANKESFMYSQPSIQLALPKGRMLTASWGF